jgi:hypothetical protein
MSNSPFDLLSQVMGGGAAEMIGGQLGLEPDQAQSAISVALPVLLGAMQRNAAQPEGAEALLGALNRDHDGSLLDNLGGFLGGGAGGGPNVGSGEAILGHVFGGRMGAVQNQVGAATGLDAGSVGRLLSMLAPIVMAFLGRSTRGQGMNAGGLSDLLGVLGGASQQASGHSAIGDLLGGILDRDGDGSMMDDVARMGMGVLGGLLGGKR